MENMQRNFIEFTNIRHFMESMNLQESTEYTWIKSILVLMNWKLEWHQKLFSEYEKCACIGG